MREKLDASVPLWRVGELADATGVSVRTLHHYDAIGLLAPSCRDRAGRRRYDADGIRRLHRITTLRALGLSLADIRRVLDDAAIDLVELMRRQLDVAEQRLAATERLRRTLSGVLAALSDGSTPSVAQLIQLMEAMTVPDTPLTPERLRELTEARQAMAERLSPERLAEMARSRQQAMAALTPEQREQLRLRRAALRGAAS